MNQEKIGSLIATLRKKKGLTQSELGALVGVGDRAVSKWERGLTCPDISIINDLSRALGITSDELLAGEVNENNATEVISTNADNKHNKKVFYIVALFVLALVSSIVYLKYTVSDVYTLTSRTDECDVVGKVIFNGNKMSLIINTIAYRDKEFKQQNIVNYEYVLKSGKVFLYQKGGLDEHNLLIEKSSIADFTDNININYELDIKINKKEIIKNELTLIINYLDEDNNIINSTIEMKLIK